MRTQLAIAIALLLAVPVAAANWNYRANNEPDTVYDTTAWMYHDPDTSPGGHKIYFNGFARVARETHYNPNVGAMGSRMQGPLATMSMVLGFWKDCNGDGYVGNAEQTFLEYPSALLTSTAVCPATPPTSGVPATGFLYPHNDGTWVRELIWIGPRGLGAWSQNPTNFYTEDAAAWADLGLPGGQPTLVCPTGNVGVRSTGALVDFADCLTYYRGIAALNSVGGPVGGWDSHDVDNSPSDANVDNPAYPLLYGPEEGPDDPDHGDYRGHSGGIFGRDENDGDQRDRLVTVVDCDADGGGLSGNPSANTDFDPQDPATFPSAYESVNDTFEVVVQGMVANANKPTTDPTYEHDPCAREGDSDQGAPYPSVEGYTEPTFADAGRDVVDYPAEFSAGSRAVVPGQTCTSSQGKTVFSPHPVLGYCPPVDGGLAIERDDLVIGPAWRTNAQVNTYSITTREGLKDGTMNIGAFYYTFYARVGGQALTVGTIPMGSASVTYGAEACGAAREGVINGWNCDPDAWLHRCSSLQPPTLEPQCYRIGTTYNMRDVDCWDNTVVRGSGVQAGTAVLSETGPCEGNAANEQPDTTIV